MSNGKCFRHATPLRGRLSYGQQAAQEVVLQSVTAKEGMGMTGKGAIYALAFAVLMGAMAGNVWAGGQGVESYGPADSSISSQPEQGVEQPNAGEIREPMETGAVPVPSVSSSDLNCCTNSTDPTYWMGGP